MSAAPHQQGPPTVVVRLSEVPERVRVHVAERMIRVGELTGVAAIDLRMAAYVVRQDPAIEVDAVLAARVLSGRLRR